MKIEELGRNYFKQLKNNGLRINPPATIGLIEETEKRLKVEFPEQVKLFYTYYNGLSTTEPPFEILPLEKLNMDSGHKIHFATFNGLHKACFDISKINEAEQWMIVNGNTGYQITFTMASFWTNKILAWIERKRPVWEDEFPD